MNWTEIAVVIIAAIVGPIVVILVRKFLQVRQAKDMINQQHILTYGKEVAIRTCDGRYVTADLNNGTLVARERHVQAWEIFKIVHASSPFLHVPERSVRYGDKVAFLATNSNNFVGAAFHSQSELTAWVAHVKAHEKFTLLRPPAGVQRQRGKMVYYGSFFALRADNGQNVMYNRDGDGRLFAIVPHVSDWETFVFIDPDHPQ